MSGDDVKLIRVLSQWESGKVQLSLLAISYTTYLIHTKPKQQQQYSMSGRPIPVALIGLGGVGKAILSQLLTSPGLASKFNLVLIANSRLSLSLPLPASPLTPTNFAPILEQHGQPLDLASIVSVLSTHPDAPGIFIDSTGSETLPGMYGQILQMGISIVTPNKKATSSDDSLYQSIVGNAWPARPSSGMMYGESTVGAGLPILSTLKDLVGTGDEIQKIEGVFSGTLSYIFNEFSKVEGGDVKFSEVVKVAKDKGYTVGRGSNLHPMPFTYPIDHQSPSLGPIATLVGPC